MTTDPDARADALAALRAENTPTQAGAPVATGGEVGDGPVTRLVVADRFPFIVDDKTARSGRRYLMAVRGDLVHITAEQAERGERLGALTDPDTADEGPAATAPVDDTPDEDLAAMSPAELVGWLNSNPDQRDRVRTIEQDRDRGPRKTVISALDQLDEHAARQAEADAEDEELDTEEA